MSHVATLPCVLAARRTLLKKRRRTSTRRRALSYSSVDGPAETIRCPDRGRSDSNSNKYKTGSCVYDIRYHHSLQLSLASCRIQLADSQPTSHITYEADRLGSGRVLSVARRHRRRGVMSNWHSYVRRITKRRPFY